MIELKPCWICGCEDVVFVYWDGNKKDDCTVHCTNPKCPDPFDYWDTEEEAARVWNMRACEDALEAVAEGLRVELFKTDKACAAADIQISKLRAEIERLRGELELIAEAKPELYGGTGIPFTLVSATQFYALTFIASRALKGGTP